MGDRTQMQVTILRIDPEKEEEALELLADYGWQTDWGEGAVYESFEVGRTYVLDEGNLGTVEEFGSRLESLGSSVLTYYGWEDAYSPWMGTYRAYDNDLGLFVAECSDEGEIMVSESAIRRLLAEDDEYETVGVRLARMRRDLDDLIGTRWSDLIKSLQEDP